MIEAIGPEQVQPSSEPSALGQLGSDAFLKLLIAQLRYQNPMAPADGTAMLQQTAQFTTVETLKQISEINQQLMGFQQVTLALTVVGKQVSAITLDGYAIEGHAESVRFTIDGPLLRLDTGIEVPMENVVSVGEAGEDLPPISEIPVPPNPDATEPTDPAPPADSGVPAPQAIPPESGAPEPVEDTPPPEVGGVTLPGAGASDPGVPAPAGDGALSSALLICCVFDRQVWRHFDQTDVVRGTRRCTAMIPITPVAGLTMLLAVDLIETIEPSPQPVIALVDGRRIVVNDPPQALLERIRRAQAARLAAADPFDHTPSEVVALRLAGSDG